MFTILFFFFNSNLVFWIVADLGRTSKFVGLSFGHLITIQNMRFKREKKKWWTILLNLKYVFGFHGRSLSIFGEFSSNGILPPVPFNVKVVNISKNKCVESEFMQLSWIPGVRQCNFEEPQSCNNNFRFQTLHALFKYGEEPNFSVARTVYPPQVITKHQNW